MHRFTWCCWVAWLKLQLKHSSLSWGALAFAQQLCLMS